MNNDFIEIYDNNVPQELCKELINWFDLCSDNNFTIRNMPFIDGVNRSTFRSDESVSLPLEAPISSVSLPGKTVNDYWDRLNECYTNYITKYDLTGQPLSSYKFKIQKVKEGQGYHLWHDEQVGIPRELFRDRMLVFMTYLKAPEKGGETEFLYQSKRIEPIVGRTLIWPAYFTHQHRGNPPLMGEKYYITGWFERADNG